MTSESELHDARIAVATFISEALMAAARSIGRRPDGVGETGDFALSIVCAMAGETATAALGLYLDEKWYAGAALTRQLVEHHYLLASFAASVDRRSEWASASEAELRQQFSPAKLRQIGGFSRTDYAAHCTWGGHPNPRGAWLVMPHDDGRRRTLLLVDLVQHLRFIYIAVARCLGEASNDLPEMVKAYNYLLKWEAVDPLSQGLPAADDAQDEGGGA